MNLVGLGIVLILAGAAAALLPGRYARLADAILTLGVLAGCGVSAFAALRVLSGHAAGVWSIRPTLPGGAWVASMDALSAWFILLLATAGGITTLFGVRYMQRERAHHPVAIAHVMWAILIASMIGVLVAQSAVLFLVTWEVMAVSAYFLIVFEHDRDDVRRAGLVYLVLTHLGTLGLLVMFLAWGHAAPDYTFASLAAASRGPAWAGAAILLLAFCGFGIKAGVFPFHFWLPGAHAAAPSHVSALLSGVMLKVGIYGLVRVLTLAGPPPAWWGWTVLGLGLASAVLGVLWALAQRDLKRALAYSSVENIGITLLGVGLGALGTAYHHPAVAVLGYTAALLHALNHALFKSLLFLGAGAVVRMTGTREIDRLGGLARRMPRTALAFTVGSLAIVGLPPLNGFVSEWTLLRGLLGAGQVAGPMRWASLGAAGIGIVGALALACFARLTGMVFLGQPRDRATHAPRDVDSGLALPMLLLAAACVSIGLAPGLVVGFAVRAASVIVGASAAPGSFPGIAGPALRVGWFAATVIAGIVAAWLLRRVFASGPARTAATWGCAYAAPTPRMQYTAASFGAPILNAFPLPASPGRGPRPGAEGATHGDRVMRDVARPVWNRVQALARSVRPLQQGRVTTYLQYMIWTVLVLLGFLLFASTGRHP